MDLITHVRLKLGIAVPDCNDCKYLARLGAPGTMTVHKDGCNHPLNKGKLLWASSLRRRDVGICGAEGRLFEFGP